MTTRARVIRGFEIAGFDLVVPVLRLLFGEEPKAQLLQLLRTVGLPAIAFAIFLLAWSLTAARIETSIGAVPGPLAVWHAAGELLVEHRAERQKERDFTARMEVLRGTWEAEGKAWTPRRYSGKPTYLDQIATSVKTVFAGFLIATMVAVPLGILSGLSPSFYAAINPLIQIFKPVSPLAWLPIVMILVSALYTSEDPLFEKSFISSAVTVSLCSLWPTLANTAFGVASVERDYLNVARVLKLGWIRTIAKVVIPAALPLIFTGLRLSLGVGWMVLIAAEMLAQNPGLGKFVWDMFQNGSSQTLAYIMVAVATIGIIGFVLDRTMIAVQRLVSFGREQG